MKANASDQAWFAHVAEMKRLFDVKAAELVAAGYRKSGTKRYPKFHKGGKTFELRRQLGSNIWYTVEL